jgi:hypothetical protein
MSSALPGISFLIFSEKITFLETLSLFCPSARLYSPYNPIGVFIHLLTALPLHFVFRVIPCIFKTSPENVFLRASIPNPQK